jgi:hypothetical protein
MSHQPAHDLAEIRSMMERSSKFLSLSGWAGILVGLYALAGLWGAVRWFGFHPTSIPYSTDSLPEVMGLAIFVLALAIATAMLLSGKEQAKKGEKGFTPASRRLLIALMVPLTVGGVLILALVGHGLVGLAAPLMLLFYGLALLSASRHTDDVVGVLGWVQIALGLAAVVWIGYGLWFWAAGFGLAHILYGIYVHLKVGR